MRKHYILDANVLLHDPRAIFKFEDNEVIIPIYAIEEIDQFKREGTERGRNAREVARVLDGLRTRFGTLSRGVQLESGGSIRVAIPERRPSGILVGLESSSQDLAILQIALEVRDRHPDRPAIFVTMDANLRIRADALGVTAETYENQRIQDELEESVVELEVPPDLVDDFFHAGSVAIEGSALERVALFPNASVVLRSAANPSQTALGRVDGKGQIVALRAPREGVMGIRPRNKEQSFALDLLLDDAVRLVTLIGKAGTGKTLLALAAGLRRTTEENVFTRLLVSRPVMPLGRDLGFLPGDVGEKLNPWMQPIFDNLELLFSGGSGRKGDRSFVDLLDSGTIQVEPLTYIRGRSLPRQYLIVDEAQNLTPHEVKTIITRCGEGTKIVLTGDPNQIDNPYVDALSNGLSIVADRFKQERIAGHVVLGKGERSDLAEIAANLL